ncbi:MAG: two-component regulator propeller domain-containing protein, partial [Ignavibacteria bacterium]
MGLTNILFMIIYKILFISAGIISFPFIIYPQYSSPEFEHISIDQGLYQSTVNCILQDRKGLLWFGTNDGLSWYDGYSFKTYKNISSDPRSISENNITAAAEDNEGNIWIGTLSGFINIYDPLQNFFVKYKLEFFPLFSPPKNFNENIPPCYASFSHNTITAIYCDKNEFIWIGTFGSGLFRFDPYENSLVQYYYSEEANTISSDYILSIAEDNKGTIWVATFTGGLNKIVNRIDPQTREEKELRFSAYLPDKNSKNSISDAKVTSLEFFGGKLWIGTFGGGLNILNLNKNGNDSDFICIKLDSGQNSRGSNLITKIDTDKNGNLWIGTFGGGLNKFNIKSNTLSNFLNNPFDQNSIDNNEIISLLSDKTGLIWVGTFSGYGINKLNPNGKKFGHYKSDPAGKNSLSDNLITAFTEDSDGNIWIGTYRGGMNKFNRKEKSFTPYKYIDGNNGISNYITCLLADENDRIWIGTYDSGLYIFDQEKNKFSYYTFNVKNKFSISSSRISSLIQDKFGTIWIGTLNKGINKVSKEKDWLKFTAYRNSTLYPGTIPSDNVLKLFTDKNNIFWAVTGGRFLSEFNYDTGEFSTYQIDSPDSGLEILSLSEDDSGNLWLGTGGKGLLKFNKKSKKYSNEENPYILKDKSVFGILPDDNNNLWISTNFGLVKYNLTDHTTESYNVNDGLQGLKYSGACIQAQNGEMFFGGTNGFNCFFPDSIQNQKGIPEIIITSLHVSNKEIPLSRNYISLLPSENSFSIYFTSTDYTDPLKNEYLFMLDGYDNEWKFASGNIHSAEYKDLPP